MPNKNNDFKTIREEVEHYTLELLSAGKEFTQPEIKDYIYKRSGKEFNEGTFTSIISKIAKNNPSVMSPRRGSYKYIKKKYHNGDNFDEMAIATLEELVIVINNLPKHINPLYVTKKQQKIFNVLKNNIKVINDSITEIGHMKND